jgi:hypothetical protein
MCCKLQAIAEIEKPADCWGPSVTRASGCVIYATNLDEPAST